MDLSQQALSEGNPAELMEGLREEGSMGPTAAAVNGVTVLVLFFENPDFNKDHSRGQHSEEEGRQEASVLASPHRSLCEAPSSPYTGTVSETDSTTMFD